MSSKPITTPTPLGNGIIDHYAKWQDLLDHFKDRIKPLPTAMICQINTLPDYASVAALHKEHFPEKYI